MVQRVNEGEWERVGGWMDGRTAEVEEEETGGAEDAGDGGGHEVESHAVEEDVREALVGEAGCQCRPPISNYISMTSHGT